MLEGLKVGFTMKAIRKERKEKEKKTKPISFNFKTTRRKLGTVTRKSKTIDLLETKTKDQVVELWKVYYIRKKLTTEQQQQYDDICYYLTVKYHINLPKRNKK